MGTLTESIPRGGRLAAMHTASGIDKAYQVICAFTIFALFPVLSIFHQPNSVAEFCLHAFGKNTSKPLQIMQKTPPPSLLTLFRLSRGANSRPSLPDEPKLYRRPVVSVARQGIVLSPIRQHWHSLAQRQGTNSTTGFRGTRSVVSARKDAADGANVLCGSGRRDGRTFARRCGNARIQRMPETHARRSSRRRSRACAARSRSGAQKSLLPFLHRLAGGDGRPSLW